MAVVIGWSAVSALDTARLYARFAGGPPSDFRILADALVARGARSAYAGYWTAYVTTFVSGERVRIASTDVVRITEYQELASSTPGVLVVRDEPCAGGEKVARWYLCRFEP